MKIKWLINFFLIFIAVASVATATLIYTLEFKQFIRTNQNENGQALARKIAWFSADFILREDYSQLNDYISEFATLSTVKRVSVMNTDGTIIADSNLNKIGATFDISHWNGMHLDQDTPPRITSDSKKNTITFFIPVVIDTYCAGFARLVLSTLHAQKQIQSIYLKSVIIGIIILSFSIILGMFASRLITRPLSQIKTITERIQRDKFSGHPVVEGPLEIQSISQALEIMSRAIITREETIRQSEGKYRLVVNSLSDGIFSADQEGIITDCNTSMPSLLGFDDRRDVIGNNIFELFCKTGEGPQQVMKRLSHQGNLRLENLELFRKDGTRINVSITCSLAVESSSRNFIVGIIRDITETLETGERLVQAQKMETVGNLAGGLAHDFNNILGGIIGSAGLMDMLIKKISFKGQEKLESYLDIIRQSSEKGKHIVEQLMTLSRRGTPAIEPVNLRESIDEVLSICSSTLPQEVKVSFDPGENDLYAMGNPTMFHQVFLNLFINASHAMTIMRQPGEEQGGQLSITMEVVSLSSHVIPDLPREIAVEQLIKIIIRDTGVGMDRDTRKHLFEPFFTTKDREKGTGLGMTMTYSIIRQFHGSLEIESDPGKGTSIVIYLPSTLGTAKHEKTDPGELLAYGYGTILLVDDEDMIISVTREILMECGYSVITARNGQEAIDILKVEKARIRGAVVDMSMPGMSGLETINHLREIVPSLPILLASGAIDEERNKQAQEAGAKGTIQKPFSAMELSHKLGSILS